VSLRILNIRAGDVTQWWRTYLAYTGPGYNPQHHNKRILNIKVYKLLLQIPQEGITNLQLSSSKNM
jgi:predicted metal-dependent hydrolase